jgi:hypothetical protein
VCDEILKHDKELQVTIMKCEDKVAEEAMAQREQMILDDVQRGEEETLTQ